MNSKLDRLTYSLLALLTAILIALPQVGRSLQGGLSEPEYHRLAQLRYEALHGDRTNIPEMIEALHKHFPHIAYIYTAVHALSHLGATEALPAIDDVIEQTKGPGPINPAVRVARARLVVEAAQNE